MNNNTSKELVRKAQTRLAEWFGNYGLSKPGNRARLFFNRHIEPMVDQSNREYAMEVLDRIEKCNNARINEFGNGEYYEGAKSHIDDLSKEINAIRKELEAGGEE